MRTAQMTLDEVLVREIDQVVKKLGTTNRPLHGTPCVPLYCRCSVRKWNVGLCAEASETRRVQLLGRRIGIG